MPSKFKIQIANPCHEEWDGMQANVSGKFCSSCQKAVIDFTYFTDAELKRWFNESQGNSCGRFKPEQLDRLIEAKENYKLIRFKPGLIAASLLAFLSLPKLSNAAINKPVTYQTNRSRTKLLLKIEDKVLSDSLRTIKGRIVDKKDKLPLVGVSIKLNDNLAYTSTDAYGYFEIKVPAGFNENECSLAANYIGYKTLISRIDLSGSKEMNLELCISGEILGGLEVVVVKYSFWRTILYKAKNQFRDINPFYKKIN